jgi:hypothetical protein
VLYARAHTKLILANAVGEGSPQKKENNKNNKNAPSFPELQNATDAIPGVKCPSNKTRNEEEEEK